MGASKGFFDFRPVYADHGNKLRKRILEVKSVCEFLTTTECFDDHQRIGQKNVPAGNGTDLEKAYLAQFYADPLIKSTILTMIMSGEILQDYHRLETSADLDPLLEQIGDAKYVLLG